VTGFIDIHCHVLAGLDDGPGDTDEALLLCRELASLGFSSLHPTPHQKASAWTPDVAAREAAAVALRQELARHDIPLEIVDPAGENMWDELFLERQSDRSFPCYAGGKAFLLEFPLGPQPPGLSDRFFAFRLKGLLPVIAHVERYPWLTEDGAFSQAVAGKAALLTNLSSLGGLGGWSIKRKARALVERGRIHALSSDAHGLPDLAYSAKGLAWAERKLGAERVRDLLDAHPRMILEGELPE